MAEDTKTQGKTDAAAEARAQPMTDEADIGSGEKNPAQLETEAMIRQIPALPADAGGDASHTKDGGPTYDPNGS